MLWQLGIAFGKWLGIILGRLEDPGKIIKEIFLFVLECEVIIFYFLK